MINSAYRTAALGALAALLAAGCTVPQSYACATVPPDDDLAPVAADPALCTAPQDSDEVTGGHRWYSAPTSDVDDDAAEIPVVGQALDGDWWDPEDRFEFGSSSSTTSKPKPTSATRAPRPTGR